MRESHFHNVENLIFNQLYEQLVTPPKLSTYENELNFAPEMCVPMKYKKNQISYCAAAPSCTCFCSSDLSSLAARSVNVVYTDQSYH